MPTGHFTTCHKCKSDMWLPAALYEAALAAREKITFTCAYGHPQVFINGETEETKLRRERDRLKQDNAYKDDLIRNLKAQQAVQDKLVTNLKKQRTIVHARVGNGVCPCCNRTFAKLARHMQTKHPEFKAVA